MSAPHTATAEPSRAGPSSAEAKGAGPKDAGPKGAGPAPDPLLARLSALLGLQRRAARADAAELPFVLVNETVAALAYRQALLWHGDRVSAASGAALHDPDGPYLQWAAPVLRARAAASDPAGEAAEPQTVRGTDVPGWSEWLPPHGLWLPLGRDAGLLLARAEPFTEADRRVASHLGTAYGQSLALARPRRRRPGRRRPWLLGAVALAGAALVPVRPSLLAPAEVVAARPIVIRAPIEGVVDRVPVRPNDTVHTGQVLLSLDRRALEAKLQVALRATSPAPSMCRPRSKPSPTRARRPGSPSPVPGPSSKRWRSPTPRANSPGSRWRRRTRASCCWRT